MTDSQSHAPAIPVCPDCGSAVGPNHVGPHHAYNCPLWAPSSQSRVAWCVFRKYELDSLFGSQEAAQERADDLTARGVDGVMVEPYNVYEEASHVR